MPTQAQLDVTFDILVAHAIAGLRCPQSTEQETDGLKSYLVVALAHAGRIRIEISGRNYRTVTILEGEHKGKSTAPDPHGRKAWMIVDHNGTRRPTAGETIPPRHRQPSSPRALVPFAGAERRRGN